jgi:hypothetical protein
MSLDEEILPIFHNVERCWIFQNLRFMQNNLHADPHNSTPAIAPTRAGSMLKKDFF